MTDNLPICNIYLFINSRKSVLGLISGCSHFKGNVFISFVEAIHRASTNGMQMAIGLAGFRCFLIHIFPIGAVHDREEFVVFFEVFVAGFQLGPELLAGGVFGEFAVEVADAAFGEAGGEDVDGDIFLSAEFGIEADGIQFFDAVVGHGHAADGDAAAVDIDVSAEVAMALYAVGIVGVVEMHGEVVVALGVELLDEVITFGYLAVALGALGAEHAREGTDAVGLYEFVFAGFVVACPELHFVLRFESAEVDVFGRVVDAFLPKFPADGVVVFFVGIGHAARGELVVFEAGVVGLGKGARGVKTYNCTCQ